MDRNDKTSSDKKDVLRFGLLIEKEIIGTDRAAFRLTTNNKGILQSRILHSPRGDPCIGR